MKEIDDLTSLKIENLNEDVYDLKKMIKELEESQQQTNAEMKKIQVLEADFQNQIE